MHEDKKEKVWSWYKPNARGKNGCLEKVLFNYGNFTDFLI